VSLMPRKSPFKMDLSREKRQTLESMARKYTSPYCDVIRAKSSSSQLKEVIALTNRENLV
jgi:hypothetical protein